MKRNKCEKQKSLLIIDSSSRSSASLRTTSNETGSFTINLAAQPFLKSVKNITLESLYIPISNYNITSSNNIIPINDGGNKTVTITPGTYTAIQLALAIQTALNISSTGWLCVYNTNTFKITFTATAGFILRFATITLNSIARSIGFSNTDVTLNTTSTGESAVSLTPSKYYIVCPEIGSSIELSSNNSSIGAAFYVPIDQNSGGILVYEPNFKQTIIGERILPGKLTITLLDSLLNLVDLNNLDWNMMLSYEAYFNE